MQVAGLTIIKNANKFQYPIAEVIEQHKDFFDVHVIGVPRSTLANTGPVQDTDNTKILIYDTAKKLGSFSTCATIETHQYNRISKCIDVRQEMKGNHTVLMVELDWPDSDVAWTEESLDKKLQQKLIDLVNWTGVDWIVKIDADEFLSESGMEELSEGMEMFKHDPSVSAISHNYLQFMGSLDFTVYDPTDKVCHIFKPGKAKFVGNDAMQFMPTEGETLYYDSVFLHHIGYVKNPKLITTRIREHLVLNASMYPDAVHNASKWEDYEFQWPKHRVGAKLWPIAISDQPNETEYQAYRFEDLPSVLQSKAEEWSFYAPEV